MRQCCSLRCMEHVTPSKPSSKHRGYDCLTESMSRWIRNSLGRCFCPRTGIFYVILYTVYIHIYIYIYFDIYIYFCQYITIFILLNSIYIIYMYILHPLLYDSQLRLYIVIYWLHLWLVYWLVFAALPSPNDVAKYCRLPVFSVWSWIEWCIDSCNFM